MPPHPEFDEIPVAPVALVGEEVLGRSSAPVLDRVTFGLDGPALIARDDPRLPPEAAAKIDADARAFTYFQVRFSCSFRRNGQPIRSARLQVSLSGAANGSQPPVAWSMQPQKLMSPRGRIKSITFSPEIKLPAVGVSFGQVEIAPAAEVGFVVATGELQAQAVWDFRATATTQLEGSQDLVLIVRCGADDSVHGDVYLSAKVGKFGLRADLRDKDATIDFAP
jgi:hypothetical protein